MATTRIQDMLKSIVNSAALYELFQAATARFDYVSAKRRCMITSNNGFLSRSHLVLPENPGERLAFIFCLLVEFDHGSVNFNEFLQQFFPEDGSYYSSFQTFCAKVITPFEEIIRQLFSEELSEGQISQEMPRGAAQNEQSVQAGVAPTPRLRKNFRLFQYLFRAKRI